MATFSWSDNFKIAFRSCSSCLWPLHDDDDSLRPDEPNGSINGLTQPRSDELQRLLANAESDVEAESMSLHSNPGRGSPSQRKKKKSARRRSRKTSSSDSNPRRITLFGFNLFGRPLPPPIRLADDSEDALYARRGTMTPNTHSTGSSTFDSDAAPLDTDTIAALSSPTTAAAAIEAAVGASAKVEAQRLKEKEERRRKRKEKKELRRMAELLAQRGIVGDGEEFEGFQGSGAENSAFTQSTHPRIPSGILPGSDSGSQWERPSLVSAPHRDDDDDDAAGADLDGSHYARNAPGGSNGGSDSRSRTSTTLSDRMHLSSENAPPVAKSGQKKSKDKSSSSRTTKSSSSNTSQSPSLRQMVSPSTIEQGQGFFDLEDDDPPVKKSDTGYLPITGFGGTPVTSRMASNLGAILAQRGGNDTSRD